MKDDYICPACGRDDIEDDFTPFDSSELDDENNCL